MKYDYVLGYINCGAFCIAKKIFIRYKYHILLDAC